MDEIISYYDKLAKIYDDDRFDNSYGKFIDKQERNILNKLLTNDNEIILDLACGSGRFMDYANYGSDASKEMVKISQQKFPHKEIYLSDAEKTTFEDNSIDTIISFHFFMHLNKEKMEKILQECDRILTKNGRIIFDIPSSKRRKLLNYKSKNWHGAFSLTNQELKKINSNFELKNSFGILFVPIHRFPKKLRPLFIKLDRLLSNSFLKEYSSYQVIEFVKK
ncbi:class I SAM-dependent methyltransferase [Bernardetia sp. OM2101]|uniref:class I SAM-dependent methyltransferase n=1 Tax=Bernardetia sp. OM2101 TaxID=3344876 RepID=UPI0035CEAA6F